MITTTGIHDMTEPEYRADPATAVSDLARYVGRGFKGKKSRALIIGSALHKAVLRPDDPPEFSVMDFDPLLNTKIGKEALKEFEDAHPGLTALKKSEGEIVKNCYESVMESKDACEILDAKKHTEVCLFANLVEGILSKGMLDIVCNGAIFDLKSSYCSDSEEFQTSVCKFGYANAAAHYQMLWEAIHGKWIPFGWIVVSKKNYSCWVEMAKPFHYWSGKAWCEDVLNMMVKHKEQEGYKNEDS